MKRPSWGKRPAGPAVKAALVGGSILAAAAFVVLAAALDQAGPRPVLGPRDVADKIVVEKGARRLTLYRHGVVLKSYRVALGRRPVGRKEREGDDRTPEGRYAIDGRNPWSAYHYALHISYPNEEDMARARKQHVAPGGNIVIHGLPNGHDDLGPRHVEYDWTDGCVAVTNDEIDEIAAAVPDGTPIVIRP